MKIFPTLLAVLLSSTLAAASENRGLAIATEADRRDQGFGDYRAEMRMTLRNRHGQESVRRLELRVLEQVDDGDKSLAVFHDPADVAGTAFLTFSHKTGDDDQWIYLPALKRVKRIATSNKSGPFMGSEFAYEDLSSDEVEEYTYTFLREEAVDGQACFVVERRPVHPKSGYRRQVAWYDQQEYRLLKVDYYDRKDALLKTLTLQGYERYLERYWRANRLEMVNHVNGKSTVIEWQGTRFRNGFSDADFDRAALSRIR